MRVGAIDCGTNSIRLLIADIDAETRLVRDVVREMNVVRLGQGVDLTGQLDPGRIAAALQMATVYAAQCREHDVEAVRFVATSASRDASNSGEFVSGVESAFADFGISPQVISGQEEAQLSFAGATGDLRIAEIPGPYLVVDIGGGSTEFVRGGEQVESSTSTDIGCVRLTERHLRDDPPTSEQIAAAVADIDAAVQAALDVVPVAGVGALVGLSGTVTTTTAHALRLERYDAERIHLCRLGPAEAVAAAGDLLHRTRADRAALPYMHPGRVDIIGGGALVWRAVIDAVVARAGQVPVIASEHDILDGIALSLLG